MADQHTEADVESKPAAAGPELLHGHPVDESSGQPVVFVDQDGYIGLMRALRADGYAMCVDITATDYLAYPTRWLPDGIRRERFEVVVNLLDMTERRRLRVRCQVAVDDPRLPSLFDIWPG